MTTFYAGKDQEYTLDQTFTGKQVKKLFNDHFPHACTLNAYGLRDSRNKITTVFFSEKRPYKSADTVYVNWIGTNVEHLYNDAVVFPWALILVQVFEGQQYFVTNRTTPHDGANVDFKKEKLDVIFDSGHDETDAMNSESEDDLLIKDMYRSMIDVFANLRSEHGKIYKRGRYHFGILKSHVDDASLHFRFHLYHCT